MEWTPDLSVGVEVIDGQHQELFRRINGLVQAVKKKECKYLIGDVIKFLEDYVVEHFAAEEDIMKKYEYPAYEQHREQHRKFMEDFALLEDELKNEQSSYTRSVYTNQIVVDWIVDHISRLDKKLGEYLKPRIGESE